MKKKTAAHLWQSMLLPQALQPLHTSLDALSTTGVPRLLPSAACCCAQHVYAAAMLLSTLLELLLLPKVLYLPHQQLHLLQFLWLLTYNPLLLLHHCDASCSPGGLGKCLA